MASVIAVLNRSERVTRGEARRITEACNRQLERDVAPLWSLEPSPVRLYASESRVPRDAILIVIVDSGKQAGAPGIITSTPSQGRAASMLITMPANRSAWPAPSPARLRGASR